MNDMIQTISLSLAGANRRPGKLVVALFAITICAVCPGARGVMPAPDGGYPNDNTAEGDNALLNLNGGVGNTAIGFEALFSNASGVENTANGDSALHSNTGGEYNTAGGSYALYSNTSGSGNTATGRSSLYYNTGDENTATGLFALANNSTGNRNAAHGSRALDSNTVGNLNTADGYEALFRNTTGHHNTATGSSALAGNTQGLFNTAAGESALYSNTTGDNNIALGYQAGANLTTGSNNIDIGALGAAGESNAIRIGKANTQKATFIQGISGNILSNAQQVVINSAGKLGVIGASSARFKEAIKPMDGSSAALLALKPVTFRYKHEIEADDMPQFGLVAEEVEKVSPDLVLRDDEGKASAVRYEAVNAMLLNEFLKEHRKVEALEQRVEELSARVESARTTGQPTARDQ